jgi:quercetin dioxygenase-like cupin family protein
MSRDSAGVVEVDLLTLLGEGGGRKPAWKLETQDLDMNLVALAAHEGLPEHVNAEVDVLLVGVEGVGVVEVGGERHELRQGRAVVLPKGTRRAIRGEAEGCAYLSCHRRRAGLWPEGARRPGAGA